MRDQDAIGGCAGTTRQVGDEPVRLFVRETHEVELQPQNTIFRQATYRLQDNDVCLDRTMYSGGRIVTGRAPHTMVYANRGGRVTSGVAESQDGGR